MRGRSVDELFRCRCGSSGTPLSSVTVGAFLGLFEAVRIALDCDDLGAMHEPIDERMTRHWETSPARRRMACSL